MKKFIRLAAGLISLSAFAQNTGCCTTYTYEGFIEPGNGRKLDINLNIMMLLDSTLVGSYYYKPKSGALRLAGRLNPDTTFLVNERDEKDSITGYFTGKITTDKSTITGQWISVKKDRQYPFEVKEARGKSYWDYIKKNRGLPEYKDVQLAIKDKGRVLSIDVNHQNMKKLPKGIVLLTNIVSINLLGNKFESFLPELAELTTLDEISLSSNRLSTVGPEIGLLKNLRILILNFNHLKSLPKESGS